MKLKEAKLFIALRNGADRQSSKAPLEVGWQNKPTKHWHDLATYPNIGMRLDGLVAVDFDDCTQPTIDKIIEAAKEYKCIVHLTGDPAKTKKGVQLIFREPNNQKIAEKLQQGNNLPLLFGLSADIKAGNKGQIVIKLANYDGDRTANSWILNAHNDYSVDDLDTLPKLFMPLAKQQTPDRKIQWENGTRNGTWMLYTRFLTQRFDKITEAEALEHCKAVYDRFQVGNDDYKTIVPDWFKKARLTGKWEDTNKLYWRTNEGNLIPDRLVDSAIANLFIRRYNGKLYVKDHANSCFITESDNGMIRTSLYDLDTKLTATDVENAIKKLLYYAPEGELNKDWKYIIYTPTKKINVKDNTIAEIPEDEFYLHAFNKEYNPQAYDKRLDEFLNEISLDRTEVRKDIIQALAVGTIPESYRKLFMFYGSGSNGKGTLFKMFSNLFASKSIKHIALEKLIEDQFMAAMMKDTIVNISDELSQQYFKEFGMIKSLISNDEIHGRAMHQVGDSFIPHVTLYLQGNMIPMTKEKTDAINNRLVFIPMDFTPNKQTAVSSFSQQFLTDSAQEYLFKLLIEEIVYILQNGNLTHSKESIALHKSFAKSNDPVAAWMEAKGKVYFLRQDINTAIIHAEYMATPDSMEISQRQLTTKIKTHFGLDTKTNGYKNPTTGEWKGTTFKEIKII